MNLFKRKDKSSSGLEIDVYRNDMFPAPPADLTIPPALEDYWPHPETQDDRTRRNERIYVAQWTGKPLEWVEDYAQHQDVLELRHRFRLILARQRAAEAASSAHRRQDQDRKYHRHATCPVCGQESMRMNRGRRVPGQTIGIPAPARRLPPSSGPSAAGEALGATIEACPACLATITLQLSHRSATDFLSSGKSRADVVRELLDQHAR